LTGISEVLTEAVSFTNITLMVEAVSTSEMFVTFYQTAWHNIPQDIHLII
jgi:hypothetical protein